MIQNMNPAGPAEWTVYILRCGDGSLYTGIAKDVESRLKKHRCGKGAAYTRTHLPVELVYEEPGLSRSAALIREAYFKRLPKEKKEIFVKSAKGAA
jgi:predicted GIY-YIG superfamily endonuclease